MDKSLSLLEVLSKQGLSVIDVATSLGVATSQIYRWNREGVNPNNPHYDNLLGMIGSGFRTVKPSKKAKIQRPPKAMNLTPTDLTVTPEQPRPTKLPRVTIRPKT